MSITTEQWQEIERELHSYFCFVKLKVDEHIISISKARSKENQYVYEVYVNGEYRLGWGWKDNEHYFPFVEQVWRKRSMAIYKPKDKKLYIKLWGKRECKKRYPDWGKKREWYEPWFPTSGPLIKQLKKIKNLEIIKKEV